MEKPPPVVVRALIRRHLYGKVIVEAIQYPLREEGAKMKKATVISLLLVGLILFGRSLAGEVVEAWVTRYHNLNSSAKAIAVDGSGNVYVTGVDDGGTSGGDYLTIKYDSSGLEQWVARYNGPGNDSDWASALAIDSSGNVYVTGQSTGGCPGGVWRGFDSATIKYSQPAVLIEELIKLVQSLNLKQGIENSLDAKLQNAVDALDAANANQRQDAVNKMEAFVNAVEGQRYKELTGEQADTLISKTNDIIQLL
jgi:hypothetical protein